MPTRHILECPACGHELLIDVENAVGGVVQDALNLVGHRVAAGSTSATPAAIATAEAKGVDLTQVEGTGKPVEVPVTTTESVPAITQADVNKAAANPAPVDAPPATPAAVAHADELGVDLADVEGTGSGGTITKSDVADHAAIEPGS
jgi:pyruvate dehydrogenase E2 component (dihydrolipoamide acetyltransferase)